MCLTKVTKETIHTDNKITYYKVVERRAEQFNSLFTAFIFKRGLNIDPLKGKRVQNSKVKYLLNYSELIMSGKLIQKERVWAYTLLSQLLNLVAVRFGSNLSKIKVQHFLYKFH